MSLIKKVLCLTLAILLALGLAACGAPVSTEIASSSASADPSAVVVFADPVLEAKVRAAMGRPEGDITAAEAGAVTEMNFGSVWPQYVSGEEQITDIGGLEYFKNLESLDLSSHAVTDISPLAGLAKLTSLSLGGNPVADISPLSGMTSLRRLSLSGCQATDYSPLSGLASLELLALDDSAITDVSALSGLAGITYLSLARTQVSDVSPLAALTSLKQLYLAECPVADYLLLADIYPNLKEKDFTVPSSLSELRFTRSDYDAVAGYAAEGLSITINHDEWGAPGMEDQNNAVKMNLQMDNGYGLTVIYYPKIDTYVFQMSINNEMILNYIYDTANGEFALNSRESAEQVIKDALGETGADDILLAPITIFDDTIRETFGMTADALFALPFGPPTLLNLGFIADQENACYLFEQHEPWYYAIEVNNPQWGSWDEGCDVKFFTPLSDEYRIVITYDIDERKFSVGADDNDGGGAKFDFFADTNEHANGWCSNNEMTLEEYFITAYNDPGIEDIYLHSVQLMEQYISDTFGMSIDELYALPAGE